MEILKKSKILIIDDDILSLCILKSILYRAGIETICTASSGMEGLAMIRKELPDLILLDYMLPDIDGFAICKKLKQDRATIDIPVFIITGAAVDYDSTMQDAFSTGASEYFTKPIRLTDLLPRMRTAITSKKLLEQVRHEVELRSKAEHEQNKLIAELQQAVEKITTLNGLLPICSSCKKIRDDDGYWQNVEKYIREHSVARFTHGICPDCAEKLYPEVYKKLSSGLRDCVAIKKGVISTEGRDLCLKQNQRLKISHRLRRIRNDSINELRHSLRRERSLPEAKSKPKIDEVVRSRHPGENRSPVFCKYLKFLDTGFRDCVVIEKCLSS